MAMFAPPLGLNPRSRCYGFHNYVRGLHVHNNHVFSFSQISMGVKRRVFHICLIFSSTHEASTVVKSFYHNFDSSHTRDASNQTNSNNCFQEVQNVKLLMHVQDHLQQVTWVSWSTNWKCVLPVYGIKWKQYMEKNRTYYNIYYIINNWSACPWGDANRRCSFVTMLYSSSPNVITMQTIFVW